MRAFVARTFLALGLVLLPHGAGADPARPFLPAASEAAVDGGRMRVGAARHWSPARFQDRLALGVGWSIPQRVYDADGRLLTERSLLFRDRDIERTGLYLAVRF